MNNYDVSKRDVSNYDVSKRDSNTCVVAPLSRSSTSSSVDRRQTYHFDDAFEDAIESQIDALDEISEEKVEKEFTVETPDLKKSKMTTSVYGTSTFGSTPSGGFSSSTPGCKNHF